MGSTKRKRGKRRSARAKQYEVALSLGMGDKFVNGTNYTPAEIKKAIRNGSGGNTPYYANSCLGKLLKRLLRMRNNNPKRIKTRVFWHLSRIRAMHATIFRQHHPNRSPYLNF